MGKPFTILKSFLFKIDDKIISKTDNYQFQSAFLYKMKILNGLD